MRNAFVDCSLLVEWDPPNSSYCGGPLYQVVISSDGDVIHNITTTRTNVTFSDVTSDTAYNVTVVAVNRLGVGATEMTNVFTGGTVLYCTDVYMMYSTIFELSRHMTTAVCALCTVYVYIIHIQLT